MERLRGRLGVVSCSCLLAHLVSIFLPIVTLATLATLAAHTDRSVSPGFGNRCQHLIFELARAAGITDLAARTPRSRNKMNVVKAAFQALTKQTLPEDVAKARGRKMVDVRSVYYGGQVY